MTFIKASLHSSNNALRITLKSCSVYPISPTRLFAGHPRAFSLSV